MTDYVGILRSINSDNVTRDYFSNNGTHLLKGKNKKVKKNSNQALLGTKPETKIKPLFFFFHGVFLII